MITKELIKQAEEGDARAQFRLGMAYYRGNRIEKSEEKAYEWWTKAAEGGRGCRLLFRVYLF